MKRHSLGRASLVGATVVAVLLLGLLPTAHLAGAASLPHIGLHVAGSAKPITVQDRHQFLVDAFGFQSGESVKIQATFPGYNGNDILQTRTATANGSGNVVGVTMYAPAGAKTGWTNLTATGQGSNKQAQGRVWVFYRPYISLNNTSITAGAVFRVDGHAFVANSPIRVQITIQGSGGNSQTITVTATADNNGNFSKWIRIPGYTSTGSYTVAAIDTLGGFRRYAKLTVSPHPAPRATATVTPAPTATPKPSLHAAGSVVPSVTLPNQDVTFTGTGFPADSSVTVAVTVNMRGGGNRYISRSATTDSNGTFTTAFRVPYKTAPGTYAVTASGSGTQASGNLQVLPLSAQPSNLTFRWVSLWYHAVRQGTWDYISIQSAYQTTLGIWVHVIFPNGQHWDYYTNTDHNGRWGVKFTIPNRSVSRHSNQAYITLQLWHGKQTTQSFIDFTLA